MRLCSRIADGELQTPLCWRLGLEKCIRDFIASATPPSCSQPALSLYAKPFDSMHVLRFILACFVHAVTAQYQFLVPDGAQTDLSESWTVGSTMEISWSKGWQGVGEELESADLWITWFRSDSYSQLLLGKPNLET